jgi:hypothetical protein
MRSSRKGDSGVGFRAAAGGNRPILPLPTAHNPDALCTISGLWPLAGRLGWCGWSKDVPAVPYARTYLIERTPRAAPLSDLSRQLYPAHFGTMHLKSLLAVTVAAVTVAAAPLDLPHAAADDPELQSWKEWAKRVEAGAQQPDGWWLKTCAGWSALMLCGAVFGAGIDEPTARAEDVGLLFGSAAESVVVRQLSRRPTGLICSTLA